MVDRSAYMKTLDPALAPSSAAGPSFARRLVALARFRPGAPAFCGLLTALSLMLLLAPGCGPERKQAPELCDLSADQSFFRCDIDARESPADCRPEAIGAGTRRRFLLQMTTVNMELLFLEAAPGSRGPFAYNDTAAVLAAVGIELCRVREGQCSCRLNYRRPGLGDLFRDAAGCKRQSRFRDDPLYFRSRGCPR